MANSFSEPTNTISRSSTGTTPTIRSAASLCRTRQELDTWGVLDASNEESYTRVPGLEHKYDSTALLLVNDVCGAYCRFCFRKRLFMDGNDEVVRDVSHGLEYIAAHPEITNVLLTGGDPLLTSTRQLRNIISQLREIDHVHIIRIGSKMPAFNPYRIINDTKLHAMFREFSTPEKRIYVMCHFNHPRELTEVAAEGLSVLRQSGVITVNQTPIIAGINDDPDVLAELFNKCSFYGVPPYYVFQCRPTLGNRMFSTRVENDLRNFRDGKDEVLRDRQARETVHVARNRQGGDRWLDEPKHHLQVPPCRRSRAGGKAAHLPPKPQCALVR